MTYYTIWMRVAGFQPGIGIGVNFYRFPWVEIPLTRFESCADAEKALHLYRENDITREFVICRHVVVLIGLDDYENGGD